MNKDLCKCGFECHPNMPCSEVITANNQVDYEYFRLLTTILDKGRVKHNRTGIDTIGVFGEQAKFEVDMNAFPILTTKKVWFKGIVHELLWFIKGDTNIKYLVDNDVHIWDEWAYKKYKDVKFSSLSHSEKRTFFAGNIDESGLDHFELHKKGELGLLHGATCRRFTQDEFIQKIKTDNEFAKKWGELGEGTYGSMWRNFPYAKETPEIEYGSHTGAMETDTYYVDQLQKVLDTLKSNPDDRRMIISAWHPYWADHCALAPCHCLFHFNTEELTIDERYNMLTDEQCDHIYDLHNSYGDPPPTKEQIVHAYNLPKRRLNCLLYQRSLDLPLGGPFNIASYSLLTAMIAQCVNMVPGTFTWCTGDTHIYVNQMDGIKEQLTRTPKKLPSLWLNPKVKNLFDFKYEDIKLIGYDPHPTIKMPVAV